MAGEFALWEEGVGIMHEECPVILEETDSRLVIEESDPDFYLK